MHAFCLGPSNDFTKLQASQLTVRAKRAQLNRCLSASAFVRQTAASSQNGAPRGWGTVEEAHRLLADIDLHCLMQAIVTQCSEESERRITQPTHLHCAIAATRSLDW